MATRNRARRQQVIKEAAKFNPKPDQRVLVEATALGFYYQRRFYPARPDKGLPAEQFYILGKHYSPRWMKPVKGKPDPENPPVDQTAEILADEKATAANEAAAQA